VEDIKMEMCWCGLDLASSG